MTDDVSAAGWVVEVLGEGLGARHRRFMVGTSDRDAAIKLVCELLGPNTLVTASSRIDLPVARRRCRARAQWSACSSCEHGARCQGKAARRFSHRHFEGVCTT